MKELLGELLGKPLGVIVFQLLSATQFTIYLSLIAFIGGSLIGLALTFACASGRGAPRRLAMSYMWGFQAAPLLMMLFLFGLGAPRLIGVDLDPWIAASIALTLYASAYLADIWRGAVEAVPAGQWEGAQALGMRFSTTLRLIIAPQAVRLAAAPTIGLLVQIIKGTSLAYIIGFHDLMSIGKRWANAPVPGSEPFVVFPLMALIYFCLCFPLSIWSRRLERRFGKARSTGAIPAA